jgi:hypothetical protein
MHQAGCTDEPATDDEHDQHGQKESGEEERWMRRLVQNGTAEIASQGGLSPCVVTEADPERCNNNGESRY